MLNPGDDDIANRYTRTRTMLLDCGWPDTFK
jgi:hypothetical protein